MAEDPEKHHASIEGTVQQQSINVAEDLESGKDTEEAMPNSVGDRNSDVLDVERDAEQTTISSPPSAERDKRFEVDFDGDDDPLNPKSKTKLQKWIITLIVSSCSFCV